MRPLIAIAVVIILLFVGKEYVFVDKVGATSSTPSRARGGGQLSVDVYVAQEETTQNTVYASGTVVANEEVSLQCESAGRLQELNISEGSYVKKGTLIARIDDRDLRAQLKKLSFEEELATQTEIRQKKLLDIDAISKEEYDLSLNKVSTLSADRELLEVQISKTRVVAPFSGYIGFKQVSEGAYLTPGVSIATMVQTNPIKIDFTIPEKYAPLIRKGQEVSFEVDGQTESFSAKVMAIDPQVDEDLRTLRVRAIAKNPGRKLLPGMFVRLSVPLGSEQSIMIPTESIVPILKGKMVYLSRNGRAEGVEIVTGVRGDDRVQVREGLTVGDTVIVSALMSIKPGSTINVGNIINDQEEN